MINKRKRKVETEKHSLSGRFEQSGQRYVLCTTDAGVIRFFSYTSKLLCDLTHKAFDFLPPLACISEKARSEFQTLQKVKRRCFSFSLNAKTTFWFSLAAFRAIKRQKVVFESLFHSTNQQEKTSLGICFVR
jgi:hypothetical protein